MPNLGKFTFMPTRSRYQLLVSFCLMSVVPVLVGVYIASLFVKFPFQDNPENIMTISWVSLFSLALSYLGYLVTRGLVHPIEEVTHTAQRIAEGKVEEPVLLDIQGCDELEELSSSLKTISSNARELLEKVEKLSLKDKLTGLHNASYIRDRLNEEIQRAIHYQCPCSFAYFVVENLDLYASRYGQSAAEEVLKLIAGVFNRYLSDFDKAARITQEEFVIIFPDRNKKKTIEVVEKIEKDIDHGVFLKVVPEDKTRYKVFAGVSEDPLDGVSETELYNKAQRRAKIAMAKGDALVEAFA
ncbi:MAG: diguanylate cyclase [Candidatus Omnitrophica bacterium]|nr:diguanylate cyclase [Candidatus Omnitrophota bacterium]